MSASTILLVDDDEVLSQVLQRVLTRQGYHVVNAHNVAQAEQLAHEHHPQLGLLDLCLPDGDGVDLARRLTEKAENLPLILLTAYPLRLRERPELAARFSRVLTKPVNLQELRDAIEAALHEPPAGVTAQTSPRAAPTPATQEPVTPAATTRPAPAGAAAPRGSGARRWIIAAAGVAAACLLAGAVWGFELYRGVSLFPSRAEDRSPADEPVRAAVDEHGDVIPDAIELRKEVQKELNITTAPVKPAAAHRPLELAGSLGLDTDKLSRVRSLFAGKVTEIGGVTELGRGGRSVSRPLRIGDDIAEGQLLAVVRSADFGQKKSDLLDALSQLALDEELVKNYEALDRSGAVRPADLLQARRNAEQSRIAARRAENSLRTAGMSEGEIAALRKELLALSKGGPGAERPEGHKDWARIEIRAHFAGTLVEKNVNPGDLVDTSTELFKIEDMRRLQVLANVREEDLPALLAEGLPLPWTVRLGADPNAKPLPGEIVHISPTVDPTQHTALAMGYVDNPDRRMRGAQFITAEVTFPPPKNTVEIPTAALVEDGRDSVVFVQPDPDKPVYVMKRVKVVKRFADVVQLSNELTVVEVEQGLRTLAPNKERVVTQNALGMKAALEDVQSKK
jgi:cobalt-zinc-cadmium efflux system membrane fusion protein